VASNRTRREFHPGLFQGEKPRRALSQEPGTIIMAHPDPRTSPDEWAVMKITQILPDYESVVALPMEGSRADAIIISVDAIRSVGMEVVINQGGRFEGTGNNTPQGPDSRG
jgi:hypothetical protein